MSDTFGISKCGSGFYVGFPCEYSISVQFGDGNYCEHYIGRPHHTPVSDPPLSWNAEILHLVQERIK